MKFKKCRVLLKNSYFYPAGFAIGSLGVPHIPRASDQIRTVQVNAA
jgi:hypothetical protein